MFFDFEGRRFEPPSLESAMSWREQALMSMFAHLLAVVLVVWAPSLSFVRDAAAAREQRLAELAAQQQQLAMAAADQNRTFVFIEPRVDLEAREEPRADAPLSDRDRVAQSPVQAENPLNLFPNAEGTSSNLVEAEDASTGTDGAEVGYVAREAEPVEAPDPEGVEPDPASAPTPDADVADLTRSPERPGELSIEERIAQAIADGSLALPGDGRADPDPSDPDRARPADGLLGRALQRVDRYAQRETFNNRNGFTGHPAPWIQFDSKGVEFGPWIRRFVAQIRRNWFVPYAIMSRSNHGNVVLTFYVHRDGSISELSVAKPAAVDAFTNSAFNALSTSNPTQPLPPEYPDDRAFFTVTFFFNESPPA